MLKNLLIGVIVFSFIILGSCNDENAIPTEQDTPKQENPTSQTPSNPTPNPPQNGNVKFEREFGEEVLRIVNDVRKQNNLPEFETDELIQRMADDNTRESVEKKWPSHWRSIYNWAEISNLKRPAEYSDVVQGGYGLQPKDVVQRWLESSGHKKTLLDPTYQFAGVSIAIAPRGSRDFTFCTLAAYGYTDGN